MICYNDIYLFGKIRNTEPKFSNLLAQLLTSGVQNDRIWEPVPFLVFIWSLHRKEKIGFIFYLTRTSKIGQAFFQMPRTR